MAEQLRFDFAGEPSARPRRRVLWRAELARLARIHADERARDAQREEAALVRLEGQLADVRFRLAEVERGIGMADIGRAPVRPGLRAAP